MPCSLQHAGGRRGIANYAQNGLARDRTLPEHHLGGCAARQEHVHPAPEADQADTLPGHHDIAHLGEFDDAPGDQPRDLGEADLHAVRPLHDEILPLIRSEENTSELKSLMCNSYAVLRLKKTKQSKIIIVSDKPI